MTITVRVYAALREAIGRGQVEVEVPEGAVVSDVFDRIVTMYPPSGPFRTVMRGAVDDSYVRDESRLTPDSEVHVITPVSGG